MKELFAEILNISISAGILIVVCILVRLVFKNMPKFVRCLMWLLVAVRLAFPFDIESPFSLLPAKEYVTVSTEAGETYEKIFKDKADNISDNKSGSKTGTYYDVDNEIPVNRVNKTDAGRDVDFMYVLSIVWAVGAASVLIYAIAMYIRLRSFVGDAVLIKDNVYQTEKISTAFVLGIISPQIYVPYGLDKNELYMSVSHEKAHIARRDHLVKPLGFIITAVYWFNPLVWIAYILLCRDIELACDEKVIKKIGYDKKKEYSQALLNLSVPRKYILTCPVAFGEVGINERIKNVLNMKKGKKIIIAVAAVICAVLAVCFLTYPQNSKKTSGKVAEAETIEATETTENIETTEEAETTEVAETTEKDKESQGKYVFVEKPDGDTTKVITLKLDNESVTDSEILYPVIGNAIITRQFSDNHQGTDISAEEGTAIVSIYSGTVEDAGYDDKEGNYISIKNSEGWTVRYSHLKDATTLSKGDSVDVGSQVGCVGSTGQSTGPHVHIVVTDEKGNVVDPMDVITE